ncbi:MAG: response regulator [Deltaproteobacteria bacterium]|nr:response regulator [Deltaproteobacteria bacterium]
MKRLKKAPDLILLDIMMPDMDAMEALDTIIEISPTTEVIMVSGLS